MLAIPETKYIYRHTHMHKKNEHAGLYENKALETKYF